MEQHGGHQHGHGHKHGHQHGHLHGDGFDWDAMADRLVLDAAITEPIVHSITPEIDGPVEQVLDVGCGPGETAITLALAFPGAEVTAVDSSEALLQRAERHAERHQVTDRFTTLHGNLDEPLPSTGPMDLIWASMVLHHVADPVATLRRLRDRLRRDGTLVMIEFGDLPRVLPPDDPLMTTGTWQRFQLATSSTLTERLGLDPVLVDWPALLAEAGFDHITDGNRVAHHAAPLAPTALAWLEAHVRRGIDMAADLLSQTDALALADFADTAHQRNDLTVEASRRVLTARPA